MISYYELLGMIKEGKAPNKIRVHLNSTPKIYVKDDDIEEYCYYILNNKEQEDENYKDYLMDSFIESMMFDKTIEILEEEKKIPENNFNYIYSCEDEHIMANFENIKTTLKDIIDYLQSKGE